MTQQPNERLLPCPFYGGPAYVNGATGNGWVACYTCGATTGETRDAETAIAQWNTRVPAVQGMVEAVAKAMQEADLHDGDEGNHYRLFDLLGFSGENKSVMITRQLAKAAIQAMSLYAETTSSESSS